VKRWEGRGGEGRGGRGKGEEKERGGRQGVSPETDKT
jgi:hypothetical protein